MKYEVFPDDGVFVARCLDVEVASDGATADEAVANLQEALELFFEQQEMNNHRLLAMSGDLPRKEALEHLAAFYRSGGNHDAERQVLAEISTLTDDRTDDF